MFKIDQENEKYTLSKGNYIDQEGWWNCEFCARPGSRSSPLGQLLQLEKRLLGDLNFVDVQNINDSLQWLENDIIDWLLVFDHLQKLHDPAEKLVSRQNIGVTLSGCRNPLQPVQSQALRQPS